MSEFKIIHRAFSKESSDQPLWDLSSDSLTWKTCLRQICFSDVHDNLEIQLAAQDEILIGLEAETFLAEVLCGLKSPLVGETEVFGQFKNWWKAVPDSHPFKKKFKGSIEGLFALTKTVREKALCGHGSQSYGSLLRKNLVENESVDIIGAGHLAGEILPWIKNKSAHRIWCRNPEKARATFGESEIVSMDHQANLSKVIVIAAPLTHEELIQWLSARGFSGEHKVFDFRADSTSLRFTSLKPKVHLKLSDFSSEFDIHQAEIQKKAKDARQIIQSWKETREAKAQVRPYGWEDL